MSLRDLAPKKIPESPKAARIAIARDVVRHIDSKKLQATRGQYLSVTQCHDDIQKSFEDIAVSLCLPGNKTECEVCAIGAATMVAVGLYDDGKKLQESWNESWNMFGGKDDWEFSDFSLDSTAMREILGQWFSREQLSLIECAFESEDTHESEWAPYEDRYRASMSNHTSDHTSEEALRAIFQNIVDNDGMFIP